MGLQHGKGGGIAWTNALQVPEEILNWTLDYTAELAEATPMNSANDYKVRLVGHKTWTITATCYWDTADNEIDQVVGSTATTLTLTIAPAQTIVLGSSSALCSNLVVNTDQGDIITVTYTFVPATDTKPLYQ